MLEPRGHPEMYGAILVGDTEMTEKGKADMGVLFCHNHGWSTMCGHATIALGRFLVDTLDVDVFPRRDQLICNWYARTAELRLHAPCGVVTVTVPIIRRQSDGGVRSDETRDVSFLSVPRFVGGVNLRVEIPDELRWAQMRQQELEAVVVDVACGGAFYVVVSAEAMGYVGGLGGYSIKDFGEATAVLKACTYDQHREKFVHPEEEALGFAYGVMVVDAKGDGRGTGLCFFADQQVDRSPCGSGVCAMVALAVDKRQRALGQPWDYHSIVSLGKSGAFRATPVENVQVTGPQGDIKAVIVKVEGRAYYTGAHTFVHEKVDRIAGEGIVVGLPKSTNYD
jgi:trans-L-3-hydroxyproline dehydratase